MARIDVLIFGKLIRTCGCEGVNPLAQDLGSSLNRQLLIGRPKAIVVEHSVAGQGIVLNIGDRLLSMVRGDP